MGNSAGNPLHRCSTLVVIFYVVMMATRTYENGMKVVGRVERRFRAECRGSTVRLTSTLQPIDTPEET